MKRLILAILLASMAIAPIAAAKQVVFDDAFRSRQRPSTIVMDRRGALYPAGDATMGITLKDLTVVRGVEPDQFDFSTLHAYYGARHASDPCKLWRDFGMACDPDACFQKAWDGLQQSRRKELAGRIVGDAAGRDIVLIIHGFNNSSDESTAWYEKVEEDIAQQEARLGRKLFPIRLYWDGLSYGFPPAVWPEAQFNGPWVGLELRRLLREVYAAEPETRVRVMTHSSGAFVITNTLGDASAGSEELAHQHDAIRAGVDVGRLYASRAAGQGDYAYLPADANIRVAMLIPAQPLTAFSHFYQDASGTMHGDILHGVIPERIVLGLSRRDFAAGKVFAPCSTLGDACMAVRTNDTCSHLMRDLNPLLGSGARSHDVGPPRIYPVRFPWTWGTSTLLGWHEHAVLAYRENTSQWQEFLSALLADDVGTPEAVETCTAPAPEVDFWNGSTPTHSSE